jgi:cyclopropane fatty-acyl-phospholipid synthase-like methyltransferase
MTPHPDWTREFFKDLFAECVKRIPGQTTEEIEFVLRHVKPPSGGRMLDVPCGAGRHSLALSQKGFAVTGVDGCESLIADARRAATEQKLSAEFHHRDMRELPWTERFDGACCLGNSFAYLGDEGDAAFLQTVARALKPGGRFVLQTGLCAESIFVNRLQWAWFPMGDLLFLVDTDYDASTSRLTSSYTLIGEDGRRETKKAIYRIYTYRELMAMFAAAGFEDVRAFSSLTDEPYRLGSTNLLIVATKK